RGEKRLGLLEDWNQCFWCSQCLLYLSRLHQCPVCGHATRQVAMAPPCDPWIFFEEEYAFVAGLLREHAGVVIDDQRLLLGNNGVRNNKFFWQVVYDGQVVLHIIFAGIEQDFWQVRIQDAAFQVDWGRPSEGRGAAIARHVAANRSTLESLEKDTIAFIDEV